MSARVYDRSDPVLFLDVDGVLNRHGDHEAGHALIRPDCAARLQRVIDATNPAVVISSAWRYQVLMGALTVRGFEYLLVSHGIRARVVGVTGKEGDEQTEDGRTSGAQRARQILTWVAANGVKRWAAVDDTAVEVGDRLVRTDGDAGLTDSDVLALIALLRGQARPERCASTFKGLRCQNLAGHDRCHEHDNRERSVGWGDTASDEFMRRAGAP
jgi:hypothetical protein